jgi:DNA-binding transcriptional LysR family regulator
VEKLKAMRVFMNVAELGSFALAGTKMKISPSATTCSIAMLEKQLNVRLVNRTTRSLPLTATGRTYFDECHQILNDLGDLDSSVIRTTRDPSGTLRIAVPMAYAAVELGQLLSPYRAVHAYVESEVDVYDALIDLFGGTFDLAFFSDCDPASSSHVVRPLVSVKDVMVASPGYLKLHAEPLQPASLEQHHLLSVKYGRETGLLRVALAPSNCPSVVRWAPAVISAFDPQRRQAWVSRCFPIRWLLKTLRRESSYASSISLKSMVGRTGSQSRMKSATT